MTWLWLVLLMIAACVVLWLSWTRWSSWDQDYRDATRRDEALRVMEKWKKDDHD